MPGSQIPALLAQLRTSTTALGYDGVIYEFASIAFAQADVCRLQYQDNVASRAWNKDGSCVELAATREPSFAPAERIAHRRELTAVIDALGLRAALTALADLAEEEADRLWDANQRRASKTVADVRRRLHLASRDVIHGNESAPPLPRRGGSRATLTTPLVPSRLSVSRAVNDDDGPDPLTDLLTADAAAG